MKMVRKLASLLLLPMLLALSGCGGGDSGSSGAFGSGGTGTTPTTPTGPGTTSSYNLVLSLTPTSGTGNVVGSNSTVIATASLLDSSGKAVGNQPILFEAVEGPVTIDPAIVNTDSSGKAINFLKAGSTTTAVDVIIKASTNVNGQLVTAVGIFTILRSETNIIKFLTTKGPTDPDGTLNTLSVTVINQPAGQLNQILQLVPFNVIDNNGLPKTRVPVTISVYSEIGNCPVFIDSPETVQKTVTTDDAGLGIFNAGVTIAAPPVGNQNSCSIIYKAETTDPNDASKTIYSYGGFIATLNNVPPL